MFVTVKQKILMVTLGTRETEEMTETLALTKKNLKWNYKYAGEETNFDYISGTHSPFFADVINADVINEAIATGVSVSLSSIPSSWLSSTELYVVANGNERNPESNQAVRAMSP